MSLPPLPPIQSAALRKQAFTDISVYRLSADPGAPELDRVENTDNNRLSFLGRAAIDYALVSPPPDLDDQLASLARSYDIIQHLHVAWRGSTSPALAQAEATRLMEAYIGALILESESPALEFIRALFHLSPKPPTIQSEPLPPPPTGQLHDLATRSGIQLEWDDRAEGERHAQDWISDISLKDKRTGRAWPCVARGVGKTKKLARADAAITVLMMWDQMGFSK